MYSQNYQEYCSRVRQVVEQSQLDIDDEDVDDDGENEVSINLEDAIATAEEINKRGDL